jgi:hypothetical protein
MVITSLVAVALPSLITPFQREGGVRGEGSGSVVNPNDDSHGLTKAQNYKIVRNGVSLEIEGVCRITEDKVFCWSPSGKVLPSLSNEIERGLSGSSSSSNRISIQYRKKNRILIFKKVTPPGSSNFVNGQTEYLSSQQSPFKEGWRSDNYWPESQSTTFDQTTTTRQIVYGAFEEKTKVFPYRYVIQGQGSKIERFPFKAGTVISAGGNSIEISAISDKMPAGKTPHWSIYENLPWEASFATIKVLSDKNLYQSMTIQALNDKSELIAYVDPKGKPLTWNAYNQLGEGLGNFGRGFRYMGGIQFDPGTNRLSSNEFIHSFPLAASLIHGLELTYNTRKIFEFENIHLDPK